MPAVQGKVHCVLIVRRVSDYTAVRDFSGAKPDGSYRDVDDDGSYPKIIVSGPVVQNTLVAESVVLSCCPVVGIWHALLNGF